MPTFLGYYRRIAAHVWGATRQNVLATVVTIIGAIVSAVLLVSSKINPPSQTRTRVTAGIVVPVAVLIVYLLAHVMRASWKLHTEQIKEHREAIRGLEEQLPILTKRDKARGLLEEHVRNQATLEDILHTKSWLDRTFYRRCSDAATELPTETLKLNQRVYDQIEPVHQLIGLIKRDSGWYAPSEFDEAAFNTERERLFKLINDVVEELKPLAS